MTAVAFHPASDSRLIVSASEDATMRVWDWDEGALVKVLRGHSRNVNDVDFDSKGEFMGKFMVLGRGG